MLCCNAQSKNDVSSFVKILSKKRFVFFVGALLVYALWGSPTPDSPSWVELAIAVCLFCFVFPFLTIRFLPGVRYSMPFWHLSLWILLVYGLLIPLIVGVYHGNEIKVIIRDLVGFLFLCLPLFLYDPLKQFCVRSSESDRADYSFFFMALFIGVGFFFACRVMMPDFPVFIKKTELLYLANSPLVMVGGLYLVGFSGLLLYQRVSCRHIFFAMVCTGVAVLFWLAMLQDMQRAPFLALCFCIVAWVVIGVLRAPYRVIVPLCCLLLIAVCMFDYGVDVMTRIENKTINVGLNMRLPEFEAIWDIVTLSWTGFLFGQGWGSSFASPAVGDLYVSFSHSLLSYMLFKTGIVGFVLTILFLWHLLNCLFVLFGNKPVLALSLFWSLVIPVFFYASYKSLDFGLLLTLILCVSNCSIDQKKKEVS